MTTRFRFTSLTTATPIAPNLAPNWSASTNNRRLMFPYPDGSPLADTGGQVGTGTNPNNVCNRQFISAVAFSQAGTLSGGFKSQMQGSETNGNLNAQPQGVLRIIAADLTIRGTAYSLDSQAAASEFSTTRQNRKYPVSTVARDGSGYATMTSVAYQAGDYLVWEPGARILSTDAVSTFSIRAGAPDATHDLPENETDTTSTSVGWLEFSQTLPLKTLGAQATGTGAVNALTTTVKASAGVATGTGITWRGISGELVQDAGLSTGLGVNVGTDSESVSTAVTATASGTGAALQARDSTNPSIGQATGTGAASGATSKSSVPVGLASGTGSAVNAIITLSLPGSAGLASGTGAASNALVHVVAGTSLTILMGMT